WRARSAFAVRSATVRHGHGRSEDDRKGGGGGERYRGGAGERHGSRPREPDGAGGIYGHYSTVLESPRMGPSPRSTPMDAAVGPRTGPRGRARSAPSRRSWDRATGPGSRPGRPRRARSRPPARGRTSPGIG